MKLTFLAHASFLIESSNRVRIITDPYEVDCFNKALGYRPINEAADIVLISHDHADHNCVNAVLGNPEIIKSEGTQIINNITITGISAYHDTQKGSARGKNLIFVIEVDNLKIIHLGDLGHSLSKDEMREIGKVDILLCPIGGYFTIDGKVAFEIYNNLKPRIMIPMHYKTPKIDFPIAKVEDFIKDKPNVKKIDKSSIEINKETLPQNSEIWFLKMARE